ncbi:MAG: YggT family protein [Candidatus Omnitrophica bacterium]|nr:YggT family protein [Candidatus Omnitrophota bacterium]
MFVLSTFFRALANLVQMIFGALYFLLVARIIVSWFQVDPFNQFVQALYKITEPILRPFRRLPLQVGMIDLSPILAFLLLWFLRDFLVGILLGLAVRFSA